MREGADARRLAGLAEQVRPQLLGQERVRLALIDQEPVHARPGLDQRHGVMLGPCIPISPEISTQGLLAPRHL